MKHLLFIFLLLPFASFGQEIKIIVTDFVTNEPLPFANIYFKKSGVGASTNMAGIAYFKQASLLSQDSLVVSYIGYDKYMQFYSKNSQSNSIKVKLKSSSQLLSEVVAKYVKPPKPEKLIKAAIRNTSKNYSTKAAIHHSLYRETVEENGTFIQLNEAFVDTYYSGYPQKNLDRKIWRDWYYDDSYSFELEGNRFFYPLLKDFNTKADKQRIVASRHSDNLSKYDIETTLIGEPLLLFAFDKIKYQYDFFNTAILNKYQFEHQDTEIIDGESCYVISFYPKSTKHKFTVDQSRKNKFPIYIGRFYIAEESLALVKFQYKLAVDRDFGFFEKRIPLDYEVEMNYRKKGNLYSVKNIKFSETKRVGKKENGESILHVANKELYVLNTKTKNITPFADSLLFKSTKYSSIRHYKKNYNPEYWNDLELDSTLQLSEKLIADLEINQPLAQQFTANKTERKKDILPPIAFKEHFTFNYHNTEVIDSLHWMALPDYENKFKKYLTEENNYAKNELVEDRKYQKKLFNKLNNFYEKQTKSKTAIKSNTYYFGEDSLSNEVFYYQKDSTHRIEVINLSLFQKKHKDIFIKRLIPNQSKSLILVHFEKIGIIGDFASILPFGGTAATDSISAIYTIQWSSDSTILYTKTNEIGSARELCYHNIKSKKDSIIYKENDLKFDVEVAKINKQLFCTIQSKIENEIYLIKQDSSFPDLELIKKRKQGVRVDIKVKDGIYLLVNDEVNGSSIEFCSLSNPSNPTLLAQADKQDYITDILPLKDKVVALVYEKSTPKLKYIERGKSNWNELKMKLGIGNYNLISADSSLNKFQFSFSSPSNPNSNYRYNFNSSKRELITTTTSLNPIYYKYSTTKRIWAKSHDGVKIPITIIKNIASRNTESGLILKVYGAYGAITTPYFNAQDAILLEQGYTIAYAHVRGESILGQSWYKYGRKLAKQNSILDYIHCAEYLIEKGHTTSDLLIGYGNSAGGLIVSQAINLKPALFNTVILDHPYLDVTNTMMDETLPLTIDEYKEWGNPQDKKVYDYILKYSPYQNIKPQEYPNVLLIGSYHDYQTPIWQIAKYTSKLRENNLSKSAIIMLTDMNSGHMGNTTEKEWIKLFAETYSFIKLKNEKSVSNKQ